MNDTKTFTAFVFLGGAAGLGLGGWSRQYKRFGAMAAFDSFQQFQDHFYDFVELFRTRPLDDEGRAGDIDLLDHSGLHVGSPPIQPLPPLGLFSFSITFPSSS